MRELSKPAVTILLVLVWMVAACSGIGSSLPDHVSFSEIDADLFRGPDHCDWDGTWFIEVPDESFGVETDGVWPVYVRDPDEMSVFTYSAESDLEVELPSGAERVGESSDGYELWFDPANQTLIYLVTETSIEAWALASDFWGCA